MKLPSVLMAVSLGLAAFSWGNSGIAASKEALSLASVQEDLLAGLQLLDMLEDEIKTTKKELEDTRKAYFSERLLLSQDAFIELRTGFRDVRVENKSNISFLTADTQQQIEAYLLPLLHTKIASEKLNLFLQLSPLEYAPSSERRDMTVIKMRAKIHISLNGDSEIISLPIFFMLCNNSSNNTWIFKEKHNTHLVTVIQGIETYSDVAAFIQQVEANPFPISKKFIEVRPWRYRAQSPKSNASSY
jgi:hypothetical protein